MWWRTMPDVVARLSESDPALITNPYAVRSPNEVFGSPGPSRQHHACRRRTGGGPELPQVAHARDRLAEYDRHRILGGIGSRGIGFAGLVEHEVDLGKAKASELILEVEIDQRLQLGSRPGRDFFNTSGRKAAFRAAISRSRPQ